MAQQYTVRICWDGSIGTLRELISKAVTEISNGLYIHGKVVNARETNFQCAGFGIPDNYHRELLIECLNEGEK